MTQLVRRQRHESGLTNHAALRELLLTRQVPTVYAKTNYELKLGHTIRRENIAVQLLHS